MLKKLSPIFSNITGVVRYQDLAYVASVSDEIQEQNIAHSYVTEWTAEPGVLLARMTTCCPGRSCRPR